MKNNILFQPKNAEMQYNIGLGCLFNNDLKQAYYWFKKAAKQGHSEAIETIEVHLGESGEDVTVREFCEGSGLVKDFKQVKITAEQGDMKAQYMLGMCYSLGDSVKKDYVQAAHWYKQAAEQGHEKSQLLLSALYRNGQGVPADKNQAMYWLRKSAEQGNATAIKLNEILTNGIEIEF